MILGMRWNPAPAVIASLAALLASRPAAGACRTPALTLEKASARAKQGAILAVAVRSDVPLSRVTLSEGGRDVRMEGDEAGRRFHALLGVDLESALGPRALRLEAEGLCGDVHTLSRRLRVVSGRFPIQRLNVAPGYVEVPPEERDRVEEEKARVARVWARGEAERRWEGAFHLPIAAPVRDDFGSRRVFNGKPRSPHNGVDIVAATGQPVAAPARGVVALAGNLYFSGGTVILDHGGGLFTTYFHLSRIDVTLGDRLERGSPIGAVGSTGRATGPHLHWGSRLHGARVNPLDLLRLPSWPLKPPS